MPKLKYVGPIDAIEIPILGVIVEKGGIFTVAADNVIELADQVGNFRPHDKAAKDIVAAEAERRAAVEAEALAAAEAAAEAQAAADAEALALAEAAAAVVVDDEATDETNEES